jgi:hypothetical protein
LTQKVRSLFPYPTCTNLQFLIKNMPAAHLAPNGDIKYHLSLTYRTVYPVFFGSGSDLIHGFTKKKHGLVGILENEHLVTGEQPATRSCLGDDLKFRNSRIGDGQKHTDDPAVLQPYEHFEVSIHKNIV